MEDKDLLILGVQYHDCWWPVNTLRPRQNVRHFADDIFKCIFFNENVWIPIKISLKFVPKGPINNIPALVQIMAWRRPGDKPLPEPMMFSLPTHICVTRPQWVNARTGLDIKHLIYMPIGQVLVVLKIDVPCKKFHMPSQYLYKPCKAYVYHWENKYMTWLKNHLPSRACNHKTDKSQCPGVRSTCPDMRGRLDVEPWRSQGMSSHGLDLVHPEYSGFHTRRINAWTKCLWPLLLTWFNFNPSMDK